MVCCYACFNRFSCRRIYWTMRINYIHDDMKEQLYYIFLPDFFFSLDDFFQGGGQDAHQRAKHLLRLEGEGEGGVHFCPSFWRIIASFRQNVNFDSRRVRQVKSLSVEISKIRVLGSDVKLAPSFKLRRKFFQKKFDSLETLGLISWCFPSASLVNNWNIQINNSWFQHN